MYFTPRRTLFASAVLFGILAGTLPQIASAESKELGNGFRDLGVATPISNHRGTVATVDGQGRNVALAWIMDHRGGYALLMIDAETGKSEQFPIPFDNKKQDSPYSSILSSTNKFYTHYGDYFVEFDPAKRAFTFSQKTFPQMSMGMTEDDNGVIWSVSYPDSGVVAFNPKTREFRDFKSVHKENWPQYQRHVAADDTGIVYFGIGMTNTQIIALDPTTSKSTSLIPEAERKNGGTAYVYRNKNGKVYGQAQKGPDSPWYEFYQGKATKIGAHTPDPKPIITDSQILFHQKFPDGRILQQCNTVERKMVVFDPATSTTKDLTFDYKSEGAWIMGLATAPDGTISGGSSFPMRFFSYNPKTDEITNRTAYGQWNTVAAIKDKFFVGGYPRGFLLEWDPSKPWVNTEKGKPGCNPLYHIEITPVIHRPHTLLPLADESMVIMGGTPEYGHTGGGLLFWDRKTNKPTILKDTDVIPDQSTHCMVELPGGKILAGTTIQAGTGGEVKAKEAQLYIMDIASKKIEWKAPLIPGTNNYTTLTQGPNGLIYGFADKKIFFVFDPAKREIVKQTDITKDLGETVWHQGPRVFVRASNQLYVLLKKGIAKLDETNHTISMVAESPVEIEGGGGYLDGRIYFFSESHLYNYKLQ